MSVSLGGISLSGSLVLLGLDNAPLVAVNTARLRSGRLLITKKPLTGGRSLQLQAEGHLTLAQVNQIKALESGTSPVTLVHHRGTFTVLITGTELEPVQDLANPGSDAWYRGSINLIET